MIVLYESNVDKPKFECVRNLTLGVVEQERRVRDLKNWIFRGYAGLHGFAD